MKNIAEEIQNVQIYPATTRVEPNDKVTKFLFNFSDRAYQKLINGKECAVTEVRHHKKHGKVTSSFKIQNADGYTQIIPLDEFDRAVLSVCVSEMEAGNLYTTPAIIFRGLTGKVGRGDAEPWANQLTDIRQSVDKMMFTAFDPNVTDAFEKLNYGDGEVKILKPAILPACRVEVTINGQKAEVIYFDRESPLMQIAEVKNQIIRYDASLLDVPNLRNTPRVITLKNYLIRRVMEIKAHGMTPTITFDDLFEKIRITNRDREAKVDARNITKNFFEHLQSKGVIKTFEFVKKGVAIHAVTFTF